MRLIDRAALERSDRQDPELIPELLEMFCDGLPKIFSQLDQGIEQSDAERVRDTAHMLKSRLRYLHCYGVGNLAETMEKQARRGDFSEIEACYTELKSGIESAIHELREHVEGRTP